MIKIIESIHAKIKEPGLLLDKRKKALEKYELLPMPSPKLEAWRYTDLRDLDLKQFELSGQEIGFSENKLNRLNDIAIL